VNIILKFFKNLQGSKH